MGFQPLLFAALLGLFSGGVVGVPQKANPLQAMCLCDDVSMPECPTNFLAGRSVSGPSSSGSVR
jgi:hypothetical protein